MILFLFYFLFFKKSAQEKDEKQKLKVQEFNLNVLPVQRIFYVVI